MKEFSVRLIQGEKETRVGRVFARSEDHAMTLIPEKYFKMGKIVLFRIHIEE